MKKTIRKFKESQKSIPVSKADVIYKALYYTASNEGVEIPEELTEIFIVLAEENPKETHVEESVDVMEYLGEFIKNSAEYRPYFEKEDDYNEI
ncbi:hypothetical protein MOD71_22010 [Bacillus haynesii]|uniref:hypothetical protein n=1 Tax=Bacillus haynesii TaxID=1925021 RepID=UPI00227EC5E1|nr:hypothetical protein [Bacillus haynesii]MCY8738157.1 hypothetical protein [Bacillus haynesii]